METNEFILINELCTNYKVEMSFFNELNEMGLIEITTIEHSQFIHQDKINDIEKMLRLNRELDVNMEGIDIIFNLLQQIDSLKIELISIKNRLHLYEND